jgi:hypothetical protein
MNALLLEIERLLQVRAHEHSLRQSYRWCPACNTCETVSVTDSIFEHKHVVFEAEQLAEILVNMLEPT